MTEQTTADAQANINLDNVAVIQVTTELHNKKLVLKVEGKTFATVTDKFCKNKRPPTQMRLNVAYLTNGDTITGTWSGDGTKGTFTDDPRRESIYADFPVPDVGAKRVSYNFTIVDTSGHERHDPIVIVFQVETC